MSKLLRVLLPAILLTNLIATPVKAEEQWQHTLVPLYLWASGIEGSSQIGPVAAPVSIKFEDALDHLDTSFTVHYEANKGKIGFLADIYHLKLKPEGVLPDGTSAGIDLSNTIYTLGGMYRPDNMNGLTIVYGLRAMELKIDASISPTPKTTLVDQRWLDVFAGLRKTVSISKKTSFTFHGDIGTGDSDLVWNAALLFDYRFNKNLSMFGGYRWLDYDYETGKDTEHFSYDVRYQGPAIALRIDW